MPWPGKRLNTSRVSLSLHTYWTKAGAFGDKAQSSGVRSSDSKISGVVLVAICKIVAFFIF